MDKRTVEDIDLAGKRVLLRVDFNVPMVPGTNRISDDSRIRESLPTLRFILDQEGIAVVCCHFGRPRGKVVEELRLGPVRQRLSELIDTEILDAGGPGGDGPRVATAGMAAGDVAILENLRFDPREEANDDAFASELASLADVYVNDAFGAAHRAHASTVGVASHLPAVAGMLMARELEMLGAVMAKPQHPAVAIIGGAKVADKIAVLEQLSDKVDTVLIGGGMVAAFATALGFEGGASEATEEESEIAKQLLRTSAARIVTPSDVITGREFTEDAAPEVRKISAIPTRELILDIGPDSRLEYEGIIKDAKTILWNGPAGVFEWPSFADGTIAIANAVAENEEATSIVGGGSTAEAVRKLNLQDKITHVSTGGGASLEFLEGKELPGVAALLDS